ncbi:hypothetical protein [Sphingosinicella sp. BN140058]|uniref:hypothetical protein n=1 Tax=Sphingosinicella sp. BN140058 TaxID=1892855 RepID=UPI001010D60C|nr:hypothetical protein [Sphingosinicella sp. BN140058]QAY75613.1 hypothetical protein ETR14_03020 [Sphingosinicella sp. BN140058]
MKLSVFLGILSAMTAASAWALDREPASAVGRCGMFPAEVQDLPYAGWSDCFLRGAGEKPLWKGMIGNRARQQVRFTFTDGHLRYVRVIDFIELADGTGRIERKTILPAGDRTYKVEKKRARTVSLADVRRLNDLAATSDVWKFETGTWDGEEIFLHCQTLDMERTEPAGYRFSSVSISCNRPRKLEPLIEFVTSLAGLKPDRAGY